MGLTINYSFTARWTLRDESVRRLVQRTARLAQEIGCAHVGKVLRSYEEDHDAPEFFDTRRGNPRRWAGRGDAWGWLVEVWSGEGCETAVFGLMPKRPRLPGQRVQASSPRRNSRWELHDFCKTMYAAEHGLDHFVRCHERVILLLDLWRRSSVRVRVHDEGGFWKARSRAALAAQIGDLQLFRKVAGSGVWE